MGSCSKDMNDGALPDGSSLGVDVGCPRCGYSLRLLTVPRCPECGLKFDWQQLVLAERMRRDNPLFEYQWRYRPVRSLLGTIARTLYPPWLWRSVPVEAAPQVGPLLILALIIAIGSTAVAWTLEYGALYYFNRFIPIPVLSRVLTRLTLRIALGALIWLTLHVFWQTRARGHVQRTHLLRIVVLAWVGSVVWSHVITAVNTGLAIGYTHFTGRLLYLDWSYWQSVWASTDLIELGALGWSLCLGLSRYLRVRRGVLLGLLTLLVVLTVVLVSVVASAVYVYDTFDSWTNPWVGCLKETWPRTAELLGWLAARLV